MTEIINQAPDEVEGLRVAIEYDQEFKGESSIIVEPVAAGLTRLLAAINNDNYRPGEGDWLQFLDTFNEIDRPALPFWPQLQLIIETHQSGYQAAEE